jgi:hypothetical protein
MDTPTRRTRFEERVRLEREFLAPVNRVFGSRAPLAGMTGDAIASWERRAGSLGSSVDVVLAAALLREAAKRAEILADNSRDVFEAGRKTGPDGLTAIRRLLEDALGG